MGMSTDSYLILSNTTHYNIKLITKKIDNFDWEDGKDPISYFGENKNYILKESDQNTHYLKMKKIASSCKYKIYFEVFIDNKYCGFDIDIDQKNSTKSDLWGERFVKILGKKRFYLNIRNMRDKNDNYCLKIVVSEKINVLVLSDTHIAAYDDNGNKDKETKSETLKKYILNTYPYHSADLIFICGDLTNVGKNFQDKNFERIYKPIEFFPIICEGFGNHDFMHDGMPFQANNMGKYVSYWNDKRKKLKEGTNRYFHDFCTDEENLHYHITYRSLWSNVNFFMLNLMPADTLNFLDSSKKRGDSGFPDASNDPRKALSFLKKRLKITSKTEPVFILWHINITENKHSKDWWTQKEKDNFYEAIKEHNVFTLIQGHTHVNTNEFFDNYNIFICGQIGSNSPAFIQFELFEDETKFKPYPYFIEAEGKRESSFKESFLILSNTTPYDIKLITKKITNFDWEIGKDPISYFGENEKCILKQGTQNKYHLNMNKFESPCKYKIYFEAIADNKSYMFDIDIEQKKSIESDLIKIVDDKKFYVKIRNTTDKNENKGLEIVVS